MVIFDAVRTRRVGQVALAPAGWSRLAEASFHLVHCTAAARLTADDGRQAERALAADASVPHPHLTPDGAARGGEWARRLAWSVAHVAGTVALLAEGSPAQATALASTACALRACAQSAARCLHDGEGMMVELSLDALECVPLFRDYGLINPGVLGVAVASHLRDLDSVPETPVSVDLGYGAAVPLFTPARFRAALAATKARRARAPLDGIEALTARALAVLDDADAVAARARAAPRLSEVLEATLIAHFLYVVGVTSIDWILQRYERHGACPPPGLAKERQVAEENRVETCQAAESCGGSWLWGPVAQAAAAMLSGRDAGEGAVARAILDGTLRNPAYPDVLRPLWRDALEEVGAGRPLPVMQVMRAVSARLPAAFSDAEYAAMVARLIDEWLPWRHGRK